MHKHTRPWESDSDYLELVADIKDHQFIKDLERFPQHIHGNRMIHSFQVSYKSYKIARKLGLDYRSVARAGLMHDLFYYMPGELSFSHGNHLSNHPYIALQNARALTSLNPIEEDIIVKHMWLATAALPKYRESYVVTMVDKWVACEDFAYPLFRNFSTSFQCKVYKYFLGLDLREEMRD
ncbi:HD domain-containing protein [Aerococcus sanguinicola]|uniref:HD domain-containing protein n=1 Tax=unclassified Aerococcus TaxID=2618060 RepID=UPI0008A45005|nr:MULTISPECIES: HD domain-containing protein [unclassified Aerococcus]MDK6232832.1 phosphohydrolase [Aerococcus sp. UMB10185]MDK6805218.1 phosphohydrolase [Aerococcus sp. UMB7834]MDK6854877.1 phosphohydrolase [Aerococcus sp. UMB7533]MDK8501856.1 phosphohydrolase [Aerococcus sp. UMB1112A]